MDNTLDGITILRFAKAFKSGGGIETHLNALDEALLVRNKLKIIKIYLETDSKIERQKNRAVGQGHLIEVPIAVKGVSIESKIKLNNNKIKSLFKSFIKRLFRDFIIYNPLLYHIFFKEFLKGKYHQSGEYPPIKDAGEKISSILKEHNVGLLVMHTIGAADTAEILQETKKLSIPFIYINHFSNEFFNHISIREQLVDAAAVAGVTDVGVPRRLKNQFYNVSNGIDIEIFNPLQKRSPGIETDLPIIIYPARVLPSKGQKDLIKAYVRLKNNGLHAKIVFAGRIDSIDYASEMKQLIKDNQIEDDVLFLGQLKPEELLHWYGVSSVLAFPTYHNEGLPRILMEAQAMEIPPVAYIIGGTPGAVQDGKTGFLVKKGDVKTFTKRLEELLSNEEKRRKMGQEGRKFVQREFSLDALAERHEKLYISILNKEHDL